MSAIDRADYEACLALAVQSLTPAAYQAAWQEGSEARLDQLVQT